MNQGTIDFNMHLVICAKEFSKRKDVKPGLYIERNGEVNKSTDTMMWDHRFVGYVAAAMNIDLHFCYSKSEYTKARSLHSTSKMEMIIGLEEGDMRQNCYRLVDIYEGFNIACNGYFVVSTYVSKETQYSSISILHPVNTTSTFISDIGIPLFNCNTESGIIMSGIEEKNNGPGVRRYYYIPQSPRILTPIFWDLTEKSEYIEAGYNEY